MNKERRAKLEKIFNQIEELKSTLETICDEEQEYYDNMPESFQSGEKGEIADTAISNMTDAVNSLEEAMSSLEQTYQQ